MKEKSQGKSQIHCLGLRRLLLPAGSRRGRLSAFGMTGIPLLLLLVLLTLSGCSDRTETVYREKAADPGVPRLGTSGPVVKSDTGDREPAEITWQTPPGWESLPAGGMRLAAFKPLPGEDALLCTLVPLKGNAGGLVSNVARWMDQMGAAPSGEVELNAFLAAQERFSTAGGLPLVLVDLTAWGAKQNEQRTVILAAVISMGNDTLFVKMSGPFSLLVSQKAAFLDLCCSIRQGESQ